MNSTKKGLYLKQMALPFSSFLQFKVISNTNYEVIFALLISSLIPFQVHLQLF